MSEPSTKPAWFAYAAKFLTALVGVIALAITQGLIEGTAAKWAAVIISALTAAGVFVVPNASQPSPQPTPNAQPKS